MKHLRLQAAAVAALALTAAGGAAAAAELNAIAPGYWETDNQLVSPIHQSKVERRCIHPQDVAKFMNGPQNHIYTCTYPTRIIGEGTIRLQGSCATKTGRPVPVSGEGTFTRDTFHMDAHVQAQMGPLPLPLHAVTDAHRLSAVCPAEPPPAAQDVKPAEAG